MLKKYLSKKLVTKTMNHCIIELNNKINNNKRVMKKTEIERMAEKNRKSKDEKMEEINIKVYE